MEKPPRVRMVEKATFRGCKANRSEEKESKKGGE